jgi:RNA-directed DNA polymerase
MSNETEELQDLSEFSNQVRFRWTMGELSKLIGVSKKRIRKAFQIIKTDKMEAVIKGKRGKFEAIFLQGYHRFYHETGRKKREILAPHPDVQLVFQAIKDWLDSIFSAHNNAYGFVRGKNTKKAAIHLLGNRHFFAFDIASAFPSIKEGQIEKELKKLKINESIAKAVAWFVTYYYEGERRLPQGAASSPILLNLVYKPMCREINRICRKNKIKWAVYADDFTFAADFISPEIQEKLLNIPLNYGFSVKKEKTKDNLGKTIPHFLGLTIVNDKVHIKRKRKKEYRKRIYAALKFGVYSSNQINGIANAIRYIYGEEKDWPGWLRKVWLQYRAENGGT